jgi:hypothetical protein
MKAESEIKKEIKELVKEASSGKLKKSQINRICKHIDRLRNCILYIETLPSEDFIKKQLEDKREQIKKIEIGFTEWKMNTPESSIIGNPKAKYNTLMGKRIISNQIKNLEYILSA